MHTLPAANGVLIVTDAPEIEDRTELLTGSVGYYFFTQLAKAGLERKEFGLASLLPTRPDRLPPAQDLLNAAKSRFDVLISEHVISCHARGLHPTILVLGTTVFRSVMGLELSAPQLGEDWWNYVHAGPQGTWVVGCEHPWFIRKGQHQYVPVLQFAAQRAVEVAAGGFEYAAPRYLEDPDAGTFAAWVGSYLAEVERSPDQTWLSVDIETPLKAKKSEEKLTREDDEDYIILRVGFAWKVGEAVSIPWTAEHFPAVERLLGCASNRLVTWNGNYDLPRLRVQVDVRGENHDAMLAWHVLNSALDKRLGFVAPFYAKDQKQWKHESSAKPAYYNAADAEVALRCYLGIRADLAGARQLEVFQRHVIDLNVVLDGMSRTGITRDEKGRREAEETLTAMLISIEGQMEQAVPREARKEKVYVKRPKNTNGLLERTVVASVPMCSVCGAEKPGKPHFRQLKKKVNPCAEGTIAQKQVEVPQYFRVEEFKVSQKSLLGYQAVLKQQAVVNRQNGRATFDEDAIKTLQKRYPKDPLYPLILDHRKVQKILSTYVGVTQADGSLRGGLRIGRDGRIHAEYTHNPSTLRLACQNPNMTNLPRVGKEEDGSDTLESLVRNLVVAAPGHILLERDYSAIEAVLTAYFARWRDGIRLAKLGVHSYLASHVLGRPADLAWSDADLKAYFKEIKGSKDPRINLVYNGCKRAIHLSNYGGTPRKMVQAEPGTFPNVKYATQLQETYFEIAAPIRKWHLETQLEAHANGYLRNPYGYIHRFSHVFRNVREAGRWVRKPGDQANEVLAFLPQSTAAGIIKEAMLRLWRTEVAELMRLQVHDSLVLEVAHAEVERADAILKTEMERPCLQLPLPASYDLGSHLIIETDGKRGMRWGEVR